MITSSSESTPTLSSAHSSSYVESPIEKAGISEARKNELQSRATVLENRVKDPERLPRDELAQLIQDKSDYAKYFSDFIEPED